MENQNEYKEYDTVMITTSDGKEHEFAIMDEFELEDKKYIVVSLVQADEIQEGYYLYRAQETKDGLTAERIEDENELAKAAELWQARIQPES